MVDDYDNQNFIFSYLAIAPSTVRPGMVFTVQFSLLKAVPNARVDASITRSQTGTIVKSGANMGNGMCYKNVHDITISLTHDSTSIYFQF